MTPKMEGAGGIREVFALAFPIIVSQGCDSIMMFTDRFFLSQLSSDHLSAALSGGVCAFLITAFHMGLLNQSTSFVAQYYGAGKERLCSLPINQSLLLLISSFPIILIIALLWGPALFFEGSGHTPLQTEYETLYFRIIGLSMVFSLSRALLSCFFSGIGKTRIVMLANILAVCINIPLSYCLIHGHLGLPEWGMAGAAWATFCSSFISLVFLIFCYLSKENQERFSTHRFLKPDKSMLHKLLRYGSPAGVEFLLQISGFSAFILIMHAQGEVAAAATTITFNWDLLAFLPLVGIQIATMSLTGRYIGAKRLDLAEKSARTALKLGLSYALFCAFIYLTCTDSLIDFFIQDDNPNADEIFATGKSMLYLACLYLPADCFFLVFGGALKGAGDTLWTMAATTSIYWVIVLATFISAKYFNAGPVTLWAIFVCCIIALGSSFFWRFQKGPWRKNLEKMTVSK